MPGRLLADCGNSAVKLALAEGGRLSVPRRLPLQEDALAAWLAEHPGAAELLLAPGASAAADLLERAWGAVAAGRPRRRAGADLPLPDLGQYPGFGLDRVLAALALAIPGGGAVVVDAGTATTLTAWRPGPRFAGGLILPGAAACLAGLSLRAPALPLVEPAAGDARADQRDTRGAIAAAIGIGYGAMVAACLERLRADSGCSAAVLTGGGAPALAERLPEAVLRPSLVLEGLDRLAG